MKFVLLLSVFLIANSLFAVKTVNCPELLGVKLNSFSQGSMPSPSVDNPYLPYAFLALSSLKTVESTLELQSKRSGQCRYITKNKTGIMKATLKGSLREGAKDRATLMTYFSYNNHVQGSVLKHDYVVYSSVKDLTEDKVLVLHPKSSVYYKGESCGREDCIDDHILIGFSYAKVKYQEGLSCVAPEEAKAILASYLPKKVKQMGDSRFPNDDQDYHMYDFRKPEAIKKYTNTLKFSLKDNAYVADVVWEYECAASSYCWGGYGVTCDKNVFEWEGGED